MKELAAVFVADTMKYSMILVSMILIFETVVCSTIALLERKISD